MDHATNWLLVQTHEMRDQSSIEFEKRNSKFYKDHRSARFLELHMLEALKMASGVGLATILVIGALLVESNDTMSVAMFITLVKVYQRVGKKTIHFCRSAIKITRGLSALRRVIDAINLPLGIGHYMDPWPDADDLASVDPQRQHGSPTKKAVRIMSSMDASGAPLKGSPTGILSPLRQTSRLMATKGKVSPVKVAPKSVGEEGHGTDAVVAIAPSAGPVGDLSRIRLQDVHFSYVLDREASVLSGVTTEFQLGGMYLLKATGAPSDLTLTL